MTLAHFLSFKQTSIGTYPILRLRAPSSGREEMEEKQPWSSEYHIHATCSLLFLSTLPVLRLVSENSPRSSLWQPPPVLNAGSHLLKDFLPRVLS